MINAEENLQVADIESITYGSSNCNLIPDGQGGYLGITDVDGDGFTQLMCEVTTLFEDMDDNVVGLVEIAKIDGTIVATEYEVLITLGK